MVTGAHGHHHALRVSAGVLRFSLVANVGLLVVQVVGAEAFESLALLADAGHQGSDVVALLVAVVAQAVAARGPNDDYTFGLRRVEVLGALVNAVLLLAAAAWVVVEAVHRLGEPPVVAGWGVATLGVAGLVVNGGCAWLLHRTGDRSHNIRGAALHLIGDAVGSLGVVIAGTAVAIGGPDWIDALVALPIAALLVWTGAELVRRTTRILLEGTPAGVELDELIEVISSHERVVDVHHLHVWSVDSTTVALSAHAVVDVETLHEAQLVAGEVERLLADHGVVHATLAVECHPCADDHPEGGEEVSGTPPGAGNGDGLVQKS